MNAPVSTKSSIGNPPCQMVRFASALDARLVPDPDDRANRPLEPTQVRLRTLYSGISAGTELTAYRGSSPYLTKRWDEERRMFVEGTTPSFEYPVDGWGYEEVGQVVEVGSAVTSVGISDVIYGAWGHRSYHIGEEAGAAARKLPDTLDPIVGTFSQIGAIALNSMLDADIHVGETVAVFGQGVPGLLVTQLAKANGGRVIGIDGHRIRLDLASKLGAEHVIDYTTQDTAATVRALTENRGADVSIEISGIYRALADAIRSTAYNSKVIAAGFFQGGGTALTLGEEFHHNRIEIVCSQISGVNPRLDHRWNELRLAQTFISSCARGLIDTQALVSHVIPATDARDAFAMLNERPAECVQVVLDFTGGTA